MQTVKTGLKWCRYLLNAKTRHGVHSPFVYSFIEEILYADTRLDVHQRIESARKRFQENKKAIRITDYGAGSRRLSDRSRKISDIVKSSATSPRNGRLLSRLSAVFGNPSMLELGTSLGIGTMYMAAGNPEISIHTLEGDPEVARLASAAFKEGGFENVFLHPGEFSSTLPQVLEGKKFGMVYLDGNHQYDSTLSYFEQILPYLHNDSLVVLDDIRWSDEMERAWKELCDHPSVTVSIDLFFQGLLFLRKEQPRQHFMIRF